MPQIENKAYMQSNPQQKIIQARRYIEQLPEYLDNTLVVWRNMPPNHLIPTYKPPLFLFSRWDVVSLHPLGGAEHNTTSFSSPCR